MEKDNETLRIIMARRSCRAYQQEQVKDEELRAVLDAGTYAPTGMGAQSPLIVAVQHKTLVDQLTKMNAEVMGSTGDPYYGAPTIVLVFVPKDCKTGFQDGSLVLGTMMLAAEAVGLGSCWINREFEMFMTAKGKMLMKKIGVPQEYVGVGALSLGYKGMAPAKRKPRKRNYWRVVK